MAAVQANKKEEYEECRDVSHRQIFPSWKYYVECRVAGTRRN